MTLIDYTISMVILLNKTSAHTRPIPPAILRKARYVSDGLFAFCMFKNN